MTVDEEIVKKLERVEKLKQDNKSLKKSSTRTCEDIKTKKKN